MGSTALAIAVLVLAWQATSMTVFAGSRAFPPPSEIVVQLVDEWSLYPDNIAITVEQAAWGFMWGNLIAIGLAIAFVQLPGVERVMLRVAVISYCLPIMAVAPILQITLPGDGPKIALAAMAVIFTTLIACLLGLRSASRAHLDLIRALGGGSWTTLHRVRIRGALPALFTGLAIAAPAALLGAIIGQFISSEQGLGAMMVEAMASLKTVRLWGIALVSTAIAGIGYLAITALGRLLIGRHGRPDDSQLIGRAVAGRPNVDASFGWRVFLAAATVAASIGVILGAWMAFIWVKDLDPYFAKTPLDVWSYLFTEPESAANRSELWDALRITLVDAGIGFVAGTVGAGIVASLFVLYRPIERGVMPAVLALRSVPLVAMTPLIVLIVGRGVASVAVIAGIVTFFPTLVNLTFGLRSTSDASIELLQVYDASRFKILRFVRIPSALPSLFASLRIAVPGAILGATIAEWLSTGDGLGNLMIVASSSSRFDMLWSAAVALTLAAALLFALVTAVETPVLTRFGAASDSA